MLTCRRHEQLDEDECRARLADAHVGRVALSIGALPAIVPVRYRVDGDDIVFEAASGTPLMAGARHVLAFEADEIDPGTGWGWAVHAVGVAQEVDGQDPQEGPEYRMAMELVSGTRFCD